MQIPGSILILLGWVVAAILIFFLYLIGRLYEIKFQQRSHYRLFVIPLVLLLMAAIWDAFIGNGRTGSPLLDFVGEPGPDLLFLLGGVSLIVLCYSLYRTMMGGKR
jgi:hypothetical protein